MFRKRFNELKLVLEGCACTLGKTSIEQEEAFDVVQRLFLELRDTLGRVYVIGNGGSAGIASHFCNDFFKTLNISTVSFFDPSILTCFANDYGYERVFSEPLKRAINPGDILVAISSSGQSSNIVNAASLALEKGATVVTFSGFDATNPLRKLGELNFWLNSRDYGIVETGHFFLLHTIVDGIQAHMINEAVSHAR